MVNKITHFSDIAMEISENQYAQTLLMSQLRSNFLVDSLVVPYNKISSCFAEVSIYISTIYRGANQCASSM